MGFAFAGDNGARVSLDSPGSSQSYEPGDNVQISGKAQNITRVSILVRNAGGGIAYSAQPVVVDGAFSTEFQLNDDEMEGQYTIRIGAKELAEPVDFSFKVSRSSRDNNNSTPSNPGGGGGITSQAVTTTIGTANVIPGAGGAISLGGEAAVVIPAGALTGAGAVEVIVQKVTESPTVPVGLRLAGSVYEFSVGGKNSCSFARDVTIKLSFDPRAIGSGETPVIEYYDEVQGQWVDIGGTVSGNTVTVQVNHFTKYAVMVVKEQAMPVEKTSATLTDVAGHWAFDNIDKLVTLGCISGYSDGSFKPDNFITRAEFATLLVKAFKLAPRKGTAFTDTAGHWAGDSIAAAAASGIVSGYDADTFGPDDLITREQMAVMIVKAAKLATGAGEPGVADSGSISGWAREAMAIAMGNGIMKGYPDNTVRPQGNATRAEAVTVIVNALNK